MAEVIALDVGGSAVKSGRVAGPGRLAGEPARTPLDSAAPAGDILAALAGTVAAYAAHVPPGELLGVALGFPGPFDYATGICRIQGVGKFEALYGVDVGAGLRAALGWGGPGPAIVFRNDAEAAIVGEARYGAGRAYTRLLGVTLGTGCGSAFVAEGRPVTAGAGVPPGGWLYPVPFREAPADEVFSTRGMLARLRQLGSAAPTVAQAAQAAREGEPAAAHAFYTFGAELGEFLRPFVLDFGAEAVLVLGGIAGALDLFGPPLREALPVPALGTSLGGHAPLLGAADLLFTPEP